MTKNTKAHMFSVIANHLGYGNYTNVSVFLNQVKNNSFGMTDDEVLAMVYGSLSLTITDKHNLIWDR